MGGGLNIGEIQIESEDGLSTVSTFAGGGSFTGASVVVNDSRITADTFVSIIPIGTPVGSWTVNSSAGSFTITSSATEVGCVFKWQAVK